MQSTIKRLEKVSNETRSVVGGSLKAGKVSQVPMITPECCKNAKMTNFIFCGSNDVISSDFFFLSTRPGSLKHLALHFYSVPLGTLTQP